MRARKLLKQKYEALQHAIEFKMKSLKIVKFI